MISPYTVYVCNTNDTKHGGAVGLQLDVSFLVENHSRYYKPRLKSVLLLSFTVLAIY